MADRKKLEWLLEVLYKGQGTKDAAKDLDRLNQEGKKASKQLGSMDKSAQALGRTLTTYLGGAVVAATVTRALGEFAKYDRQLNAVAATAKNLGVETDDLRGKADAFLQTLEQQTGVLRQDSLPTFQKFVGITKSVQGAMFATKLAADLTNAGLGDMRTNGERLANLLQGEVTEAAKALGLQLRDTNGRVKTQTQLLDELIEAYEGFGSANQDTQSNIEKLGAGWNDFKQSLGEGIAVLFNFIGGVENLGKIAKITGLSVFELGMQAYNFGRRIVATAGSIFNLKRLFSDGPAAWAEGVRETFDRETARMGQTALAFREQYDLIWQGQTQSELDRDKAVSELREETRKKELEREKKQAYDLAIQRAEAEAAGTEAGSKARLDAELRVLEEKQKKELALAEETGASEAEIEERYRAERLAKTEDFARRQLQAELAVQDQLLQAQLAAAEEGSQEQLALGLKVLQRQEEQALQAAQKLGLDKLEIEQRFQLMRATLIDRFNRENAQRELERFRGMLEAEHEARTAGYERQLADQEDNALAGFDIERQRIESEHDARLQELINQEKEEVESAERRGEDTKGIHQKYSRLLQANEDHYTAAKILLTKREKQAKESMYQDMVLTAGQALSAIFGDTKAAAYAQAVVDTWAGVGRALGAFPPPYSFIMAALVAAAGLANVRKIASTEVQTGGSGFDDPINDRLARLGGRRWARDLVDQLNLGFREGLRDSDSPASVTTINRSEDHSMRVSFGSTPLGGRRSARKIVRTLDRARFRDRARRVE